LTDQLDQFVADRVASGRYENASEVVRAGLRELELHEATEAAKLERLKALVAEGLASGVVEDFDFDELMAEVELEGDADERTGG